MGEHFDHSKSERRSEVEERMALPFLSRLGGRVWTVTLYRLVIPLFECYIEYPLNKFENSEFSVLKKSGMDSHSIVHHWARSCKVALPEEGKY
jgi:hypothetical protein